MEINPSKSYESTGISTQSSSGKPGDHISIASFKEPVLAAKELSLGSPRWVFWEQYEGAPGNFKKTSGDKWSELIQEVAWFDDIVSFWQLWQALPISNLQNYFFDRDQLKVPTYNITVDPVTGATDKKRIFCLSLFQEGIKPYWDHRGNAFGSEYRIQYPMRDAGDKADLTYISKIWEDFVLDLISHRIPHVDQIAGIRISDKSRNNEFIVRLEVWLKFPDGDKDPRGVDIKNYITSAYLEKHGLPNYPDNIKFENHNKGHLYSEGPLA